MNQQEIDQKQQAPDVNDYREILMLIYQKKVKHPKGIVFIGGSRKGKSTFSALIAGMPMRVIYHEQLGLVKIQPISSSENKNKNIIQHTKSSVTAFPNIYQTQIKIDPKTNPKSSTSLKNDQFYTVIDLPGFNDSSYYKQVINWNFIRSIINQLDEVLFVLVIQGYPIVNSVDVKNEDYEIMKKFYKTFITNQNKNVLFVFNYLNNVIEKGSELKKQIIMKLNKKLQDDEKAHKIDLKLKDYFKKILTQKSIFLIQRESKIKYKDKMQELKIGFKYENDKFNDFIRDNLKLMQKKDIFNFKLAFPNQDSENIIQIKKFIIELCDGTNNKIKQIFRVVKKMFSTILLKNDEENLSFDKIKSQFSFKNEKYFQKIQQISFFKIDFNCSPRINEMNNSTIKIIDILAKFVQITQILQKQASEKMENSFDVGNKYYRNKSKVIQQKFKGILQLLFQISCVKMDNTHQISLYLKKIYKTLKIQIENVLFMTESIQNFKYGQLYQYNYYDNFSTEFNSMLIIIPRLDEIKNGANKFINEVIDDIKLEKNKIKQFEIYGKIRKICLLLHLKNQRVQIVRLNLVAYFKNLNEYSVKTHYQEIKQILIKYEQFTKQIAEQDKNIKIQEKIQYKPKDKQEWNIIQYQSYVQLVRFLVYHSKKNLKQIISYYQQLNHYHIELFDIIKLRIEDYESKNQKLELADILSSLGDYFHRNIQFTFAEYCYTKASQLYGFKDNQRTQMILKICQVQENYGQNIREFKNLYANILKPWQKPIGEKVFNDILRVSTELAKKSDIQTNHGNLSKSYELNMTKTRFYQSVNIPNQRNKGN